ncbi:hypothetical protein AM493_07430 [Flavobacterium akiainvivens]|uniref:Uncharacterized protein n=2 Tax=Flavobacterium akiainvivens TaxID=1202724 RepID=A0A0M8MAB3_9FLAO|nr:hypothetical protein AM493_07430 [Flavobacterium akiainvivens]
MFIRGIIIFQFKVANILFMLLLALSLLFFIIYLKQIKYVVIKHSKLKYYSVFHPFGKILDLNNYQYKLTVNEQGKNGGYEVLYLIDSKNKASFKLMQLHYQNFEDLKTALNLTDLKYNLTFKEYVKLLFFGKLILAVNRS